MTRAASILALGFLLAAPAQAGKHTESRKHFSYSFPAHHGDFSGIHAFGGAKLGVGVTDLSPELRQHFGAPVDAGVMVSQVMPDSAAEAAGIEVGDIIVRMGTKEISNGMVLRDVVQTFAGEPASVDVLRNGKIKELTADIAKPDFAEGAHGRAFDIPGGKGNIRIVVDGDDVQVDVDSIREMVRGMPQMHGLPESELDDLHLRLDDLEQQLLEMTERMEQATDQIQERIEELE